MILCDAFTGKPNPGFQPPRIGEFADKLPNLKVGFSADGKTLQLLLDANEKGQVPEFRFCDVDANTGRVLSDVAIPLNSKTAFGSPRIKLRSAVIEQ